VPPPHPAREHARMPTAATPKSP